MTGSLDDAKEQIPSEHTTEESIISAEEKKIVQQAVCNLPEKYRIPVLLFYMEQLSVKEIASILSLPAGTVKSRLHQARKLLEKELEVFFS